MPTLTTHNEETLKIGDQLIVHDRACTVADYAAIQHGGTEECSCSYCRNFLTQRELVYPDAFKRLADQLGIDLLKEAEVFELGPADTGKRLYGGWFYFCGKLLEAGERQVELGNFAYFVRDEGIPASNQAWGGKRLALEFSASVRWVLQGENPD